MKLLADISQFQSNVNWEEAKKHIDGAILRCGFGSNYTSQDDKKWKRNADECTRLGIPFGVYLYSYATTPAQAASEAEHILRLVKGYKLSYPIYIDLEEPGRESVAVTVAQIIGPKIEAAGYWFGVYASEYWFNRYLGTALDKYTKWCAKYSSNSPKIPGSGYDIWQYTSKGTIAGIPGVVDLNHCYREFNIKTQTNSAPEKPIVTSDPNKDYFEEGHRNGTRFHTVDAYRIRRGAGIDAPVIGVLPKGTECLWYGYYRIVDNSKWYKVVANGMTGYVFSAGLTR